MTLPADPSPSPEDVARAREQALDDLARMHHGGDFWYPNQILMDFERAAKRAGAVEALEDALATIREFEQGYADGADSAGLGIVQWCRRMLSDKREIARLKGGR